MIAELLRCKTAVTLEKKIVKEKEIIENEINDFKEDMEYLKKSKQNVISYFTPSEQDDFSAILEMFSKNFK